MLLCGLALFSFFLHSLSFPRCQPKEAGLHQTCQMRHVLLFLLCLLGLLCRSSSSRSWPRALSLRAALITAQTSQVRRRPALPALPAAHMEVSLWPLAAGLVWMTCSNCWPLLSIALPLLRRGQAASGSSVHCADTQPAGQPASKMQRCIEQQNGPLTYRFHLWQQHS